MTPTNITYTATSDGGNFTAGRFKPSTTGYASLMTAITAQTPGTFAQLSLNTFSSVWTPNDYRPSTYANSPAPILIAWPSIGWDYVNHRFVAWGGGHANTCANEPYIWDATRRLWMRAFLPAEHALGLTRTVDINMTPGSAHTYCGNKYLPILNRFLTFCGPTTPGAQAAQFWVGTTPIRYMGAYTLDLDKAGLDFLGGTTGTNPQVNTTVGVSVHGASAWEPRDWYGRPSPPGMPTGRINYGSAYTQENGHDVIYLSCGSGARQLWRIEFVDHDHRNDILTQITNSTGDVGQSWGALAIDPVAGVVLNMPGSTTDWVFADLKRTPGGSNAWQVVANSGIGGDIAAMRIGTGVHSGLCFDTRRGKFMVYEYGADMYEITVPAGNPTPNTGWSVTKVTAPSGSYPAYDADKILGGLFVYAKDLGGCIAVYGDANGDVWFYKPIGWTDPRLS